MMARNLLNVPPGIRTQGCDGLQEAAVNSALQKDRIPDGADMNGNSTRINK